MSRPLTNIYLALIGVVQPGEQLDDGGLPRPVLAHQGHGLVQGHPEADAAQGRRTLARIGEGDVAELDAFAQGEPERDGVGPVADFRLVVQELEQVVQVQPALVQRGDAAQNPLEARLDVADGLRVERQVAQGQPPRDGLEGDVQKRAAGHQGRQAAPQKAHGGAARQQGQVLPVEAVGDDLPAVGEVFAQAEQRDLLVVGVLGQQVREVDHQPPVGRLPPRQPVAAPAVAGGGDEAGDRRDQGHGGHDPSQPGHQGDHREERDQGADDVEDLLHHAQRPLGRFPLGFLQGVVELRLLEESQVQPVGVLHDRELDVVAGQLLEGLLRDGLQGLEQRVRKVQSELHRDQDQHPPDPARPAALASGGHHGINQQLADPRRRRRNHAPDESEQGQPDREPFVRGPDQPKGARQPRERRPRIRPELPPPLPQVPRGRRCRPTALPLRPF